MNVSLYIAKRYLFTKSSNNAVNIITGIAAIGVLFASAALFIVLSGFAGLKDFTLAFTTVTDPDLKLIPTAGKTITLSQDHMNTLENQEGIVSFSKLIEERVFISANDRNNLAVLKGVDQHYKTVIPIDSILVEGQWLADGTSQIVSGILLANTLSYGVFDFSKALTVYVPKPGTGQVLSVNSAFNSETVANVGLFDINENLNQNTLFASLEFAQSLLSYQNNQVSAVDVKVNPNQNMDLLIADLTKKLGPDFSFKTRIQLNDATYKMLNTEYLAVYLIFTLILIIALFNVIGSIVMILLDKKESSKTFYNIGLTIKEIKRIFFYQGSLMSILGGGLGLLLGVIIILLQKEFSLIMITPTLAYPVKLTLMNVLIVITTISILGIIASKIATSRISKQLITIA